MDSEEELVSIIMPSYNSQNFIGKAIESVIAQTYKNWELIIVDDCSSDNSLSIAQKYALSESRIVLLSNSKNSGAAFSRNIALSCAKGKWVAFLDSDDLWLPEKLFEQINFMKRNNCSFSYTMYEQIDENAMPLHKIVGGPKKCSTRTLYRYNYLGCLTVMYDKEVSGNVQIDQRIKSRNDYALWLKIIKTNKKCLLLEKKLAMYRVRTNSVSHSKFSSLVKNHYRVFRISEGKKPVSAFLCVIRNLFFGFFKKTLYTKNVKY